jgi:hypothetical protein
MNKGFKIVVYLIVALILLTFGLTLTLDSIVKSNIESTGSELLQTDMTVDRVSLSLFQRHGSLNGIQIENPEGFESGDALRIHSIDIRMNPFSLLSGTVVIEELEIQNLEIFFQLKATGSNLGRLRSNLQEQVPETGDTATKNIIIDRFLMQETSLTVHVDVEDVEPFTATLTQVERTGIGRDEETDLNGVMKIVLDEILQEAAREGRNIMLREGGRRLLDQAEDAIRNLFD